MFYRQTGFEGVYNQFEVPPESVGGVVGALRTLGIRGINVTMPYKQAIIGQLDALSPEADRIGAVNTVDMGPDGTATGYNTDYYGFLGQLAHADVQVGGRRFVVCGMSGAGKAVYNALVDSGAAEVLVASTSPQKGVPYESLRTVTGYDTIVNCTPLGMRPNTEASVVDAQVLRRFSTAVDIVYNPVDTLFLRTARDLGLKTVGGLPMLVFQGIKSFQIWTGREVPGEAADSIINKLQQRFL